MKIGFVNFAPLEYDVSTPYKKPLGGTESAMCYLSVELVKRGHDITFYGRYSKVFRLKGVTHKPQEMLFRIADENLDFLINQTYTYYLQDLKEKSEGKTKIVLWQHLTHNQPVVFGLSSQAVRSAIDAFVFVSNWQMKNFLEKFNLNKKKCRIIKNAISPTFENIFSDDKSILKHKDSVLAYTSTPFRGLESLLFMFPEIKRRVPKVILKVFSSMDVYQKKDEEKKQYQYLYDLCKKTDGVEYIGSISQTRLAQELKSTMLLTYPTAWAETSCIATMEALAAGCKVVTTDLAALPETSEGFAYLVPANNCHKDNREMFINYTVKTLTRLINLDKSLDIELIKQTKFYNQNYIWEKRAIEWEKLLLTLV